MMGRRGGGGEGRGLGRFSYKGNIEWGRVFNRHPCRGRVVIRISLYVLGEYAMEKHQ